MGTMMTTTTMTTTTMMMMIRLLLLNAEGWRAKWIMNVVEEEVVVGNVVGDDDFVYNTAYDKRNLLLEMLSCQFSILDVN